MKRTYKVLKPFITPNANFNLLRSGKIKPLEIGEKWEIEGTKTQFELNKIKMGYLKEIIDNKKETEAKEIKSEKKEEKNEIKKINKN